MLVSLGNWRSRSEITNCCDNDLLFCIKRYHYFKSLNMKIDDKVTPYAAAVRMHFLDVNDNIGWKRYDMLH